MARRFNGSSDRIIVDDARLQPNLFSESHCCAVWVKGAAQANTGVYSEGQLASTSNFWWFGPDSTATSKMRWSVTNGPTAYVTSATVFDNTWHHWALVVTNHTYFVYVDGVLDGSGNITSTQTGAGPLGHGTIGALGRTTPGNFFTGQIAHLAHWRNTVLSAEQIRMLARGHLPSQYDPTNYWPLTGPEGNTAPSLGKRHNHGTLVGTTLTGDNPPVYPRPAHRRYYVPQQHVPFATAFNGKATFAAVVTAYQRIVSSLTGTSTLSVTLSTFAGGSTVPISSTLAGTSSFTVKLSQPHLYPLFDGTSTFTVSITEAGAPHIIATFAGVGTLTFGEDLGPPGLRLSQAVFEVLGSPDNVPVRLSQVTVEVARPRTGLHIWAKV